MENETVGVEALANLARGASAEPIRFQAALNLIGFDHSRRQEARDAIAKAEAEGMPRAVAERIVKLEEQLKELGALDGTTIELDLKAVSEVIADAVSPLIARIKELETITEPCGNEGCSSTRGTMPIGCGAIGCKLAPVCNTPAEEGALAFKRNLGNTSNPYESGSIDWQAWLSGWDSALHTGKSDG